MALLLKNTHTLTGSWISNILSHHTRIKPERSSNKIVSRCKVSKYKEHSIQYIVGLFLALYSILCTPYSVKAYDPLSVSNNRFGVHIISAAPEEADQAAAMVNTSGGDWGYVTVV